MTEDVMPSAAYGLKLGSDSYSLTMGVPPMKFAAYWSRLLHLGKGQSASRVRPRPPSLWSNLSNKGRQSRSIVLLMFLICSYRGGGEARLE